MNSYLGLVLSFGFFTSAGGSLAVDPSLSPSLFTPPWQWGMIVLILLFMRTMSKVMSSGCSSHPGWRLLVRLSLHSPHLLSTTIPLLLPVMWDDHDDQRTPNDNVEKHDPPEKFKQLRIWKDASYSSTWLSPPTWCWGWLHPFTILLRDLSLFVERFNLLYIIFKKTTAQQQ